jgi:hypothetical protein
MIRRVTAAIEARRARQELRIWRSGGVVLQRGQDVNFARAQRVSDPAIDVVIHV